MEGVRVLFVRVGDLSFVTACVFADLCIFGVAVFLLGELIKYRIYNDPPVEVVFGVTALVYATNLVRFALLYRDRIVQGHLDKVAVVLRVCAYVLFLAVAVNPQQIFGEPNAEGESFWWERGAVAVFLLVYSWSTYHYYKIVWGTRDDTFRVIRAFEPIEEGKNTEVQDPGNYPKTWGKVRVLEPQNVEGGDSFVDHYEGRNKKGRGKKAIYQTVPIQATDRLPETKPQPTQAREPIREPVREPVRDVREPPKQPALSQLSTQPMNKAPTNNVFGKIRTMENEEPLGEADSWIKRYEKKVLGKDSQPTRKARPAQRPAPRTELPTPTQPEDPVNKPQEPIPTRAEPLPRPTQPQNETPKEEKPQNKPQTYGKIRVAEEPEPEEKNDWVQRYEREVLGGGRYKTKSISERPLSEEQLSSMSRQTFQESTDPLNFTQEQVEEERQERVRRELAKIHGKVRVLEETDSLDPQNSFVKAFEKERKRRQRDGAR